MKRNHRHGTKFCYSEGADGEIEVSEETGDARTPLTLTYRE
jgi:hypothetical protein